MMKFIIKRNRQSPPKAHSHIFMMQHCSFHTDFINEPTLSNATFYFHITICERKSCIFINTNRNSWRRRRIARKQKTSSRQLIILITHIERLNPRSYIKTPQSSMSIQLHYLSIKPIHINSSQHIYSIRIIPPPSRTHSLFIYTNSQITAIRCYRNSPISISRKPKWSKFSR